MKIFKKPIFVSISPNAQLDDVLLALRTFLLPWKWKEGKEVERLEQIMDNYLLANRTESPSFHAFDFSKDRKGKVITFESGRTALYAILQALGVGKGDEVLIQAFTCTAAVNPILWVGAKPVYVDVEDGTFNMSPEDLKKKITPKSKIVIMQHTFGFPAKVDEILELAKQHDLIVLEDCAHSLGAEYKGRKVGTFGKASIFSFGRSKIISSVFGGAAFSQDPELANRIRDIQQKWQYPSYRWIAQQLIHPIYLALAKRLYNFFGLGKFMIILAKKLHLISLMVYSVEKSGGKPPFGPARMPNALAILALNQMNKLNKFNNHRLIIAGFYKKNLSSLTNSGNLKEVQPKKNSQPVFLNFPIQVKNFRIRWKLIGEARRQGIYLESWPAKDKKVIGPDNVCQEKFFYNEGECPMAEKAASTTINLPTSPNTTTKDARRVVEFIRRFFNNESI